MTIDVEVAYALPGQQFLLRVAVPEGATAAEAIERSGVLLRFPEIELANASIGIFSHVIKDPQAYRLRAGDRVEIYRPLIIDPKEARARRARKGLGR